MISTPALRALKNVDWDFVVSRAGYVPPPHWYPGTFVSALSDAMVEALSPTGGVVFDPYSGIGTSGWSAVRNGRSCILTDINPVAVLTSYYSTSSLALAARRSAALWYVSEALAGLTGGPDIPLARLGGWSQGGKKIDSEAAMVASPSPGRMLKQVVAGTPIWAALEPWFGKHTFVSLKRLHGATESLDSAFAQIMALCMISNSLRSLSSQNASWGHIADNVLPRELREKKVPAACERWLNNSRKFWQQAHAESTLVTMRRYVEVRRMDWARDKVRGTPRADLLLTSPPYAGAIDYFLAQRLSLYFLGYDDDAISGLVRSEIGARRKRSSNASRSAWAEDLVIALHRQLSWLKRNAAVCLVLPHKDSGRSNGEERLREELIKVGFEPVFRKDRSIHQSHTRQSWTSIKRETISIFARGT